MYTLIVRSAFDAAHCLPGYDGKCARLHGHTYRVEAEFQGDRLNEQGMLLDFVELRSALEAVLPDHANLNEILDVVPTAENIARWVYDRLQSRGLPVAAVTVWETDHYGCRYASDGAATKGG